MVQGHCEGKRVERIAVKKVLIFGCRFVTVFYHMLFFLDFFWNVYCIFFGTEVYYAK